MGVYALGNHIASIYPVILRLKREKIFHTRISGKRIDDLSVSEILIQSFEKSARLQIPLYFLEMSNLHVEVEGHEEFEDDEEALVAAYTNFAAQYKRIYNFHNSFLCIRQR